MEQARKQTNKQTGHFEHRCFSTYGSRPPIWHAKLSWVGHEEAMIRTMILHTYLGCELSLDGELDFDI